MQTYFKQNDTPTIFYFLFSYLFVDYTNASVDSINEQFTNSAALPMVKSTVTMLTIMRTKVTNRSNVASG